MLLSIRLVHMPNTRSLTEALSKGRAWSPQPPRHHPTFPTTSANTFFQPQRQSNSASRCKRPGFLDIPRKLHLSTNQRPCTPPPPPSQDQLTDAETERAIAEAERIAFSSLAWSHSVINSGNPIFSQDFDNEPPPIYQPSPAPAEASISNVPIFAPYAFTTSITNTGNPFDDYDYDPVNQRHVRSAPKSQPPHQHFVSPAFTTSITNTGIPYEDFDLNLIDPSLSRPASSTTSPPPAITRTVLAHTTPAAPASETLGMSDSDYAAFLEKQSGDSSMSAQKNGGKDSGFTTSSVNTEVPAGLSKIEATYASEADEAFEPVALSLGSQKAGKKISLGRSSLRYGCDYEV